ncbi:MAG: hypothetical protein FWE42_09190 [Defluviitaleaceae bacterium]|nr:hypothetical protein [Defluviitaleaceae bacterium]
MKTTPLFHDNFAAFPIGEFPYDPDHSAMGEYQYVMPQGHQNSWQDQVCNYTWNGTGPSWIITESNGSHFMECMRIEKNRPHTIFPTLQTGSLFWHNYKAECTVRRLSTNGVCGLAFCMQNSLNTLVFQMEKNSIALVHRHKDKITTLAKASFAHNCDDYYVLCVDCDGDTVGCYVNTTKMISVTSPLVARGGKIGITADCPTQFSCVSVLADGASVAEIAQREDRHKAHTMGLQSQNPKMKVWKKIDLQNFGTSRQVRFGHLCGGSQWHIVLAQAQKRVSRDAYPHISCLTAIDLDGNILWQRGEPSENAAKLGKISADLPFQVYDIDGDGEDEVICAINFELLILEGSTGHIKHRTPTPLTDESKPIIGAPPGGYAFDRLNVDAISTANLSGKPRPSEILIKDRYCRLFALDASLNLLWQYHSGTNTGHFPLAVDINNDGRDEILCGYHLLSPEGRKIWAYPITEDHVDEIVYGKFMAGSNEGFFACVAGSEGFFIGDTQGNIIMRDGIGHAQRVSIANYDPARPGFEIAVSNFWGHQGVIYLYDSRGNPILEMENELNGNLLTPVNWKGDGQDYFLTNADPARGGLYDIKGQQVVAFPDDGHPTMCCEAANLTGDVRDELVVWDYNSMWIYVQDDAQDKNDYCPSKCPAFNASNYRGEFSF